MNGKQAALVLSLAGFVFLAALIAALILLDPFAGARSELEAAITVGITESEVKAALGSPEFEYSAADAPEHYYVSGYSYRRRAISNKVHIYVTGEPICYVWYDHADRVEDYYVGGS